jgi:hypothetical protein
MALPRSAVHASSLVALAGLLSLLLADSAPDACETTPFDRTFDVTTTCKGDSTARIRIKRDFAPFVHEDGEAFAPQDVQVLSGTIDIQGGEVMGSCSGEDEPFVTTGLTFTVGATAAEPATSTGLERATCIVDFARDLGKEISCFSTDVSIADCTLKLTAVP